MPYQKSNYIHNGKSLRPLVESIACLKKEVVLKKDLLSFLIDSQLDADFYADIIKSYGSSKTRKIFLSDFSKDIKYSELLSERFHQLGCRGFSFRVQENIRIGGDELLPDINFRIALMPSDTLFYPPRVRRYLKRILINHYKLDGYPSICFALGKLTQKKCFIYVIQSDIVFRTPAFIREHFRGWRKVFMNTIIELVKTKCNYLYLPSACDVLRCSHPFQLPDKVPEIWKAIYDQTAKEFGFAFVDIHQSTNIQIYKNLPPIEVNEMYKLKIN